MEWSYLLDEADDLWAATREHVVLTVLPVLAGLVIALPLAVLAARRERLRTPILAAAGVLYTVPALAMIMLLLPLLGLGYTLIVVALTTYTLIILVRNGVDGLESVARDVREAATAMGYRPNRLLVDVELPLALPVLVAGVRIATVSTIGLVPIGALVGAGGLGNVIYNDGFRRFELAPIVYGLAVIVVMAVVADVLLVTLERRLTPWRQAP